MKTRAQVLQESAGFGDEPKPIIDTPEFPEPSGALAPVPDEVRKQWNKTFRAALAESISERPDRDATQHRTESLREANKVFRVSRPEDHSEAREIPEWQILRRQEVSWQDVPAHVQAEIRAAGGRASGTYLEFFAIDGQQYFFPIE